MAERAEELRTLGLAPDQFDTTVELVADARKRLGNSVVDSSSIESLLQLLSTNSQQKTAQQL